MSKKIIILFFGTLIGILAAVFLRNIFIRDTQSATHEQVIRVGYMANITHMQALVGRNRGDFEKAFGPDITIKWQVFNAGPSMMTALLAGELDVAYVGPGPAINVFLRSKGEAVRMIAGAASGGSGFAVRGDEALTKPEDFRNKRIATPQIGNTQDIACRYWLKKNGLELSEFGGDVSVIPLMGADQLFMLRKQQIDAVWAVEPWLSRLIYDGGAKLLIDERTLWPGGKYLTTVLLARTEYLKMHPERIKQWLRVHVALTEWIRDHREEAGRLANEEFKKVTTKKLSSKVLAGALGRLEVISDPLEESLKEQARRTYDIGFLGKKAPDLTGMVDRTLLDEVTKAAKQQ